MFSKSFISIYFLTDKILVFQLSSNKKKVKKHAVVDLPQGLIKDSKVADVNALSKVLKSVWSKLHIGEKSVGLVIPEFSTFTKYFKLPQLTATELDEAVRWQAQEFLPTGIDDMLLDWRILNKEKDGTEVSVVAVENNVLSGYVEATEKADLFPMVVETPSICLSRLTKETDKVSLVIYKNFGHSLLLLSQKEKIIGTSVLNDDTDQEVANTASKMISHYKDFKVERVLIAGGDITNEFVQKLKSSLKLNIEPLRADVEVPKEVNIQQFLVPLSMQLSEPAEPADPSSLNLLPSHLVDKYRHERSKLQGWGLTLTVTLFVWVSFFAAMGAYFFMSQEIDEMKQKVMNKSIAARQMEQASQDATRINTLSDKILKIKKSSFLPQKILNFIYRSKPDGIRIDSYSLDLDKGKIALSGVASDRRTLVSFEQKIDQDPDTGTVDIPISNFEVDVDLEFQMTFDYLPLTEQQPTGRPVSR